MKIDKSILLEVIKQANLIISDNDVAALKQDVDNIFTWLEPIKKIDVNLNKRFFHYGLHKMSLRSDKHVTREQDLLSLSAKTQDNLVIVPSVVKKTYKK